MITICELVITICAEPKKKGKDQCMVLTCELGDLSPETCLLVAIVIVSLCESARGLCRELTSRARRSLRHRHHWRLDLVMCMSKRQSSASLSRALSLGPQQFFKK